MYDPNAGKKQAIGIDWKGPDAELSRQRFESSYFKHVQTTKGNNTLTKVWWQCLRKYRISIKAAVG